jgi:hypothetical protein
MAGSVGVRSLQSWSSELTANLSVSASVSAPAAADDSRE